MCLKFNVWKIPVSPYYLHFYSKDCTKFIMWLGNIQSYYFELFMVLSLSYYLII